MCGETIAKGSISPDRLDDVSFRELLRELFQDRDVQRALCEIDCRYVPPPATTTVMPTTVMPTTETTTVVPTTETTTVVPTTSTETTETTTVMPTTETTTVVPTTSTETTEIEATTVEIFWSAAVSQTCQKNDCGNGYEGQHVLYALEYGAEYSLISQEDADAKALANLEANCQANANKNGGCLPLYYNTEIAGSCTRDNCGSGYNGTSVSYTVPAGMFSSTVSQTDAQAQAQAYYEANCQANANANGQCTPIEVGNDRQCGSAYRNNCGSCQSGSSVQLCVEANTYYAASKAAANQLAMDYINANKQAYANSHGTCTSYTGSPYWVWTGETKCASSESAADGTGPYQYRRYRDEESECSPSYGQYKWVRTYSDGPCATTTTTICSFELTCYGKDECENCHVNGSAYGSNIMIESCSPVVTAQPEYNWLSVYSIQYDSAFNTASIFYEVSLNPSTTQRRSSHLYIQFESGATMNLCVIQEVNGSSVITGC
jgi:hypothetical protein